LRSAHECAKADENRAAATVAAAYRRPVELPPSLPAFLARPFLADERLPDAPAATRAALQAAGVRPVQGARVAVAVGSRGIDRLAQVVRATVDWLREAGSHPFVIPAMGSHGGATAEGQRAVLAAYGIDEASLGAPIVSTLAVRELPRGDCPVSVHCSQDALSADATVVINRVKPHTDYTGPYESGLMKMIAIGLGKHAQPLALHRHGVPGLRDLMPRCAAQVLRHGNLLLGVALGEDARGALASVDAMPAADIPAREPALLALARRRLAHLPCALLDVLIVDQIGKDVSGTGMDTNVIGRRRIDGEPEPASPRIGAIVARRLTSASHGNGTGVGLADVVCPALAGAIDQEVTAQNVRTSGFPLRGVLPTVANDDRHALSLALARGGGAADWTLTRAARILDTKHLDRILVSPLLAAELRTRGHLDALTGPVHFLTDDPWS